MELKNYKNYIKFESRTILAIDYGLKFVGIATYAVGNMPFPCPYTKISYKNDANLIDEIIKICNIEDVSVLVVGVPRLLDGKETNQTKLVRAFISSLREKMPSYEIYEQDETLSTFEAQDRMKKDPRYNFKVDLTKVDELSAVIILEDFIKAN